jgi:hypothetical protein
VLWTACLALAASAAVVATSGPSADAAAAQNPPCVSRAEYQKLRMTAKPWESGTTLPQARRAIGSLGTAVVPTGHSYDPMMDGYDDTVGLDYRTAIFAFGSAPDYQYGDGASTPACAPWTSKSYAVLVFRRYEWRGGHGPWRLVGPRAPQPSTEAAGFRGHTFAHWQRDPADTGTPGPGEDGAAIDIGRWRELRIGMSVRAAIATGMVTDHATGCDSRGLTKRWARRGWVSFGAGNRIDQMAIWSVKERTGDDLGVGSTLAELEATYPELSDVEYQEIEGYELPYVYLSNGASTLTFQFETDTQPGPDSAVGTMVLGGPDPQVLWVAC